MTPVRRTATVSAWVITYGLALFACKTPPKAPLPPAQVQSPVSAPVVPPAPKPFTRSPLPRIDVHTHISLGAGLRAMRLLEKHGIVHVVNLSGPPPGLGLEEFLTEAEVAYGRITVFTNLNFQHCENPGYGEQLAADLAAAKALGARGVKIPKALGLAVPGPDGKILAVDAPGLDPVFEKAGELGMPIAIHVGDPQAFWEPPGDKNERNDELSAHPEWSFYEEYKAGKIPSWEGLFAAYERRVARHPKTVFIGVHFGNAPEVPSLVARMLDRYPNLYIDLAARIPAIGRRDAAHDGAAMKAFFEKYQDRILFGTDTGVGRAKDALMFGSTGLEPPTQADEKRFYESTYRYLETGDRDIDSPTPIQGRWNIDGVGLSQAVLEKIYFKNAMRLLKIKLPTELLPKQQVLQKGP